MQRAAWSESWRVRSIRDFDLWYHGIAMIGFEGYGPLRMYDSQYAERIRAAKVRRGIYPTLLDRKAASFREAFYRDSAFEILHFLPLYFLAQDTDEFLTAVRVIARPGSSTGDHATGLSRPTAVTAIGSVLATRRQRELLTEFLDALEDERRVFYDGYERESNPARSVEVARLERYWNTTLAPVLAPYFERLRIRSGLIVVSPALGAEGRFIDLGRADGPGAVVAAGLPALPADHDAVALAAVRELCFPIVHGVFDQDGSPAIDRVAAERLSSVAAVRCGALVLERYAPALTTFYQMHFLRALGSSPTGASTDADFTRAFQLPRAIDASLRQAIASL